MSQKPNPFKTTTKANRFDSDGKEVLNPTPIAPPIGYNPAPSLAEQIRQQVHATKLLAQMEPETEEEADDFEIEEDPAMPSPWENDMVPSIRETRARLRALEREEARLVAQPPGKSPSTTPEGEPPSEPEQQHPHAPVIARR